MKSESNPSVRWMGLALVLGLQGCATPYVAPSEGPRAKLRVQMQSDTYVLRVGTWENGLCVQPESRLGTIASARHIRQDYAESERSQLGMLGGTSEVNTQRIERVIRAERPFSLNLVNGVSAGTPGVERPAGTIAYCNLAVEFTPRAGRQYEVEHSVAGNACFATVNELVPIGVGFSRVPVQDVSLHQCSWGRDKRADGPAEAASASEP